MVVVVMMGGSIPHGRMGERAKSFFCTIILTNFASSFDSANVHV
jgi:hypothetical protein